MHRREFVVGTVAVYGAAASRGDGMMAGDLGMMAGNRLEVKALAFDVWDGGGLAWVDCAGGRGVGAGEGVAGGLGEVRRSVA